LKYALIVPSIVSQEEIIQQQSKSKRGALIKAFTVEGYYILRTMKI